jgi:carboxypeptidase Taq
VVEFTQVTSNVTQIWERARQGRFRQLPASLEKVFELRRRYADCFAPYDHVYDPLLDDFEPGLKTADVKAIFEALRPKQVELIHAITNRPQVEDAFLHLQYEDRKQWDFGVQALNQIGYDWTHSRQDRAAHPFTTTFSINDVRITTRIIPDNLGSALFSTLHEGGHAMYELGVSQAFERTTLAGGTSLAIHESQSRMWENLVGRSMPFWQYFYPRLQETFPAQLGNVPLETFYKGINKVQPSLIRVEADEATYNLHIMLRLELRLPSWKAS